MRKCRTRPPRAQAAITWRTTSPVKTTSPIFQPRATGSAGVDELRRGRQRRDELKRQQEKPDADDHAADPRRLADADRRIPQPPAPRDPPSRLQQVSEREELGDGQWPRGPRARASARLLRTASRFPTRPCAPTQQRPRTTRGSVRDLGSGGGTSSIKSTGSQVSTASLMPRLPGGSSCQFQISLSNARIFGESGPSVSDVKPAAVG